MKIVDSESRYSIFMELHEWLVDDVDLANELFFLDGSKQIKWRIDLYLGVKVLPQTIYATNRSDIIFTE